MPKIEEWWEPQVRTDIGQGWSKWYRTAGRKNSLQGAFDDVNRHARDRDLVLKGMVRIDSHGDKYEYRIEHYIAEVDVIEIA